MQSNFLKEVKENLKRKAIVIPERELTVIYVTIIETIKARLKNRGRALLTEFGTFVLKLPENKKSMLGLQKIHNNPELSSKTRLHIKFLPSRATKKFCAEIKEERESE